MLRLFPKFAFWRAKPRERDYRNPPMPFAEMLLSDMARLDSLTIHHPETREPQTSQARKAQTTPTR